MTSSHTLLFLNREGKCVNVLWVKNWKYICKEGADQPSARAQTTSKGVREVINVQGQILLLYKIDILFIMGFFGFLH